MKEVSDLTSRLPLKQHLRNTTTVLKTVNRLDPRWLPLCAAGHLLGVANGYLALILSAYILDALGRGGGFQEVFRVTAIFCGVMFLLENAASWLRLRAEAKQTPLYVRYHALTEEKMLDMDYARINSPECEILKRRIQEDLWIILCAVF